MPLDHHGSCPASQAWDIPNVPCSCPSGWPRNGREKRGVKLKQLNHLEPWARVVERCEWVGQCFIYRGKINNHGYGRIFIGTKQVPTHRLVYEHFKGQIPEGFDIDHVKARGCQSTACCNPDHLEAVSHRENILRGDSPSAVAARRTHCAQGHVLADDNLSPFFAKKGWRSCRLCYNARRRAARSRAK